MNDSALRPVFLKLPPEHIARLKFIVESYEELGILRTLNPDRGEVVILALHDTICIVKELLQSIASELELREIPEPDSVKQDWLLA